MCRLQTQITESRSVFDLMATSQPIADCRIVGATRLKFADRLQPVLQSVADSRAIFDNQLYFCNLNLSPSTLDLFVKFGS